MSLPANTATILQAAGFENLVEFTCGQRSDGTIVLRWHSARPQPTDNQINNVATDVAPLPSGQLFSEWLAENGGDLTATRRRKITDAFTNLDKDSFSELAVRALVDVLADKLTIPRATLRTAVVDRMLAIVAE